MYKTYGSNPAARPPCNPQALPANAKKRRGGQRRQNIPIPNPEKYFTELWGKTHFKIQTGAYTFQFTAIINLIWLKRGRWVTKIRWKSLKTERIRRDGVVCLRKTPFGLIIRPKIERLKGKSLDIVAHTSSERNYRQAAFRLICPLKTVFPLKRSIFLLNACDAIQTTGNNEL